VKEFKSFGTVPANEQPKQETSVVGTSWTVAFANFNEADDSYEWIGKGELQASISGELYGLRKVSGSKTVVHNPWPSTGFFIDRSLTDYRSFIFVPAEEKKYGATMQCENASIPTEGTFLDVYTRRASDDLIGMDPGDLTLRGTETNVADKVAFAWYFYADIPE
jgi:hypothetical protein